MQIYIKSFSLAIKDECRPYGVEVQLLSPYFVYTKIINYSRTVSAGSVFVPDVESYGKSAVFTLGKTIETTGYWSHAIQVSRMLPFEFSHYLFEFLYFQI